MSTLAAVTVPCPRCGASVRGEIGLVVNLDRRPDLADRIRARTFNVLPCACGARTEVVRTVALAEFARAWWCVCYPAWCEAHWADLAAATRRQFDRTFGSAGRGWTVRVVFGPEALREARIAAEHGISPVAVEVGRVRLISAHPSWIATPPTLVAVGPHTWSWRAGSDVVTTAATPDTASPLFGADPFCSWRRLVVRPVPADPLDFALDASPAAHAGGMLRRDWDDREVVG